MVAQISVAAVDIGIGRRPEPPHTRQIGEPYQADPFGHPSLMRSINPARRPCAMRSRDRLVRHLARLAVQARDAADTFRDSDPRRAEFLLEAEAILGWRSYLMRAVRGLEEVG